MESTGKATNRKAKFLAVNEAMKYVTQYYDLLLVSINRIISPVITKLETVRVSFKLGRTKEPS